MSEKYEIVLIGEGWLYNYVSSIGCECNIGAKNKIYVICDANTYNRRQIFNKPDSIYIFLYDFVMHYYYQNPIWYYSYCKNRHKGNVKSIITGISYIKDAVSHDSIMSLANVGQDLEHDFMLFRKYMECKEKADSIQNVIIGMSPYSLRYSMKHSKINQRQLLCYNPILGNIPLRSEDVYYNHWYECQSRLIRTFIEKIDLEECFFKYYVPEYGKIDFSNVVFNEKKLTQEEYENFRNQIRKTYSKPYEDTFIENKKILKEYIHTACLWKLKVFCFIPPYTKLHKREWKEEYLAETREYIRLLKKEYDFYDLDLAQEDWPDWYFYDEGHLNAAGQKKATELLLEYIKSVSK